MINDIENLDSSRKSALLEHLLSFITEERKTRFYELIAQRTRHLTIVLEDIYQPHNASAVLRSCDCFGIQDVHIIENKNKYEVNPDVALGSAKWLTLYKYNRSQSNTASCISALKQKGYRIVATTPHKFDFTPDTLPLDTPFALIFGTEMQGLTQEAVELADQYIKIPMFGFTESLNISVSAAVLLHSLINRLRNSAITWSIPEDEKTLILLSWAAGTIRKSDVVIRDFLKKYKE